MSGIYEWATVVCLAALTGALVELLTPSGKMEKMVRFVLGAFMICAILTPLTGTAAKITFDLSGNPASIQQDPAVFQKKLDAQIGEAASQNVRDLAVEYLEQEGIRTQKIEVLMDTSGKDSISINKLIVHLGTEQSIGKSKAKQVLEEKLGLPVEVESE